MFVLFVLSQNGINLTLKLFKQKHIEIFEMNLNIFAFES